MSEQLILIGPFIGAEPLVESIKKRVNVIHSITANEGLDSIQDALQKQCVSVILDLFLKDEDGLIVLGKIKSRFPMVEVIALAPEMNSTWAIAALKIGAYCFETYRVDYDVLGHYLAQIEDQFDLFKVAEHVCQENRVQDIASRMALMQEFLLKRRGEGRLLTNDELGVFIPFTDTNLLQLPTRILVVEDEIAMTQTIENVLAGLLKFEVTVARNITQAKALIAKLPPFNVAILDIGLPEGWGTTLIQPILEHSPNTEIIMLTAFDTLHFIHDSFQLGAADYITKPFDITHFQQLVSKAAQRFTYKSILAQSITHPVSATEFCSPLRINLLQEWVKMRMIKGKSIQVQELSVFLPSFKPKRSERDGGEITPGLLKNGVAPFLLNYAQEHQLAVSEEELMLLDKISNGS